MRHPPREGFQPKWRARKPSHREDARLTSAHLLDSGPEHGKL